MKNASAHRRFVTVLFPKALRPAALCFTMGMGTWLFACGPHFPSWLLSEGDQAFLRAPWIRLKSEMRALIGGKPSPYKAVEARKDRPTQTMEVALADLSQALQSAGYTRQEQQAIQTQHRQQREIIHRYRQAQDRWESMNQSWFPNPNPEPTLDLMPLAEGLPEEFAEYLKGAIAYHRNQFPVAREAWKKLLNLPPSKRHYRSTWALYMLGRMQVDRAPAEAIQSFQTLRKGVDEGFSDTLGLAAASLGWEARAAFNLKQYDRAIELYLEQWAAGQDEPSAHQSIERVIQAALKDEDADLLPLAEMEASRTMVTLFLSQRMVQADSELQPDAFVAFNRWLKALESSKLPSDPLVEPLALGAYRRGLFDLCSSYLRLAPTESLNRAWLASKCAFREGDLEKAYEELTLAARLFPDQDKPMTDQTASSETEVHHGLWLPHQRLWGELGMLTLQRGDYLEAMKTLLNAGYWMDGAYIAEQVLTSSELQAFIDQEYSTDRQPYELDESTQWGRAYTMGEPWPKEILEGQLRYLLARRLTREGQFEKALDDYPNSIKPIHLERMQAIRSGGDPSLSLELRAKALWKAARLTRYQGMELMGTELAPDWSLHQGNFQDGVSTEGRQQYLASHQLKPTAEEKARTENSHPKPNQRWHYRHVAANLAWEAIAWMPDDKTATAEALCEAGGWLKDKDPEAADRFYKALVTRCSTTALGQAAAQLRWFPPPSTVAPETDL